MIVRSHPGLTPPVIAALIRIDPETVRRPIRRDNRYGLRTLPDPRARGRPRKVTRAWERLHVRTVERDPRRVGVLRAAWTAPALAATSGSPRSAVHSNKARAEALQISPPPRVDLDVEDETELALLPTLTRCWMHRGRQRMIPAPGTNRKRHLFIANAAQSRKTFLTLFRPASRSSER